MTVRTVWQSADGGSVAATGVHSIREFAELVAGPSTERALIRSLLNLDDSGEQKLPQDEELVAAVEAALIELGVVAEQVPEEIFDNEIWEAEGIFAVELDDESIPGFVKVLSVSY